MFQTSCMSWNIPWACSGRSSKVHSTSCSIRGSRMVAKRRASVSFLILEKTTSGWSRALNRFSASKERNSPSKCRGNSLVNPAYKNSTVDGVYPTRKFLRRSAFIGVGRLWLCLGWGWGWSLWGTKSALQPTVIPVAFETHKNAESRHPTLNVYNALRFIRGFEKERGLATPSINNTNLVFIFPSQMVAYQNTKIMLVIKLIWFPPFWWRLLRRLFSLCDGRG